MHGLQSDLCHFYIADISRLYDWCEDCFNSHYGYIQTQTYSKLSCLLTSCFHPRYLLFHHVSPFLSGFRYLPLVLSILLENLAFPENLAGVFCFALRKSSTWCCPSEWCLLGRLDGRDAGRHEADHPAVKQPPKVIRLRSVTPLMEARSLCMYQL